MWRWTASATDGVPQETCPQVTERPSSHPKDTDTRLGQLRSCPAEHWKPPWTETDILATDLLVIFFFFPDGPLEIPKTQTVPAASPSGVCVYREDIQRLYCLCESPSSTSWLLSCQPEPPCPHPDKPTPSASLHRPWRLGIPLPHQFPNTPLKLGVQHWTQHPRQSHWPHQGPEGTALWWTGPTLPTAQDPTAKLVTSFLCQRI